MDKDNNGFILRYQHEMSNTEIIIKVHQDSTVTDLVKSFRSFMLACGYQPDNINEALGEDE